MTLQGLRRYQLKYSLCALFLIKTIKASNHQREGEELDDKKNRKTQLKMKEIQNKKIVKIQAKHIFMEKIKNRSHWKCNLKFKTRKNKDIKDSTIKDNDFYPQCEQKSNHRFF